MRVISLALLIGLSLPPIAQAQSEATNLDFEEGGVGSVPPGWFIPTAGYQAKLADRHAHEGKQCVLLESDEMAANAAPFGNIMQVIDAKPYRGKLVRLKAAIRISPAGASDRAQMWFRVDREGRKMGFFNNMGDRPIRNQQWNYYKIEGDIDGDAVAINIGVMLLKRGRVWVDDVSLEVVGEAQIEQVEPPRPLKGHALSNLVAFSKLLGYVRYFHPSDEVADADWEELAIAGVRKVESAKDPYKLARQLEEHFSSIAPTVRVFSGGQQPPIPDELRTPTHGENLRVCTWRHLGVGTGGTTQSIYRSWREFEDVTSGQVPNGFPDPAKPFVTDLGGGVSCMIPRALFANEDGARPHAGKHDSDQASSRRYTGDDRATRLAAVALGWNVFQHFYPYFDVVKTDWNRALREALQSAATDGDELAFLHTLRRMVAELHDGHGTVWHRSDAATATLPILWDWVEDHLVITATSQNDLGGSQLQRGNVVWKINGRDAAVALADAEKLISGSPQWRRYRGLQTLRMGKPEEEVTLLVGADKRKTRSVTLRRTTSMGELAESRPEQFAELKPGIIYVDVGRLEDGEFTKALPTLRKAGGLVIDFRGYPRAFSETLKILGHLTDETLTCAQWHIPKVSEPDRKNMEFQFSNWPVAPRTPRLRAKVAFIADARAISASETIMGIVEHYGLGAIVGGPTAGTNGNVNPFELPGGYRVVWTGMKVLKHDGSQHHLVGIQPTVSVARTVRAIAEGRDELLERAVEVVSR